MHDVMADIRLRKSVRAFTPEPIPQTVRDVLFEAAFQAPTAGNQMLYTILDIQDKDLKAALAESCDSQPFIAAAPMVLVFLADCRRWLDTYRAAGLSPRAPGLGDVLLAMQDAVIAAQNVVVAAQGFGLGSCYIGDILENVEHVRELLSLPQEVVPAAMLVLGYPTQQQMDRPKPQRFDGEYIVFQDRYQTLSPQAHRDMFQRREAKSDRMNEVFNARTEAFWKRKYESDFSREMSRSAGVYLEAFRD